ncbi:hypothetical protein ALC53_00642 [Atta colombica]|uniref:Uncharacterized protein n=1 Tax=Atta colombica TaxID=520822 RepID=A0A195BWP6_9HYME|nr:hypothetical protein ALC53_00642 [Atta colombica]
MHRIATDSRQAFPQEVSLSSHSEGKGSANLRDHEIGRSHETYMVHRLDTTRRFFLCSAFPTWQTVPATCKPSDLSSSTAFFTFASLRLLSITLAPSCAKRLAMERPILTSIPLRTCPKTTCFPSSQSVLAVHRKNCDPFVFGPELAIDRVPGPVCFNSKFSSSNLLP